MKMEDVRLLPDPPLIRFDHRVVWITGASRGLGRALAFGFAGAGASVMLSARSEEPLREVAERIRESGGEAEIVVGSVTDPGSISSAVAGIEQTWGRLHALINNAGISPTFKRSELVNDDEWRSVLDANLSAPFACCRAALPLFANTDGASVVNVSSLHGQRAHERLVAYAASKGGLEMLTRTLALEWAARGVSGQRNRSRLHRDRYDRGPARPPEMEHGASPEDSDGPVRHYGGGGGLHHVPREPAGELRYRRHLVRRWGLGCPVAALFIGPG